MELPRASVCHQSARRLRIKIPSRRGDAGYFSKAVAALSRLRRFDRLAANPQTGSLLFEADAVDAGEIAGYAAENGIFALQTAPVENRPILHGVIGPVRQADRVLRSLTAGKIDLPSGIFLGLLASGLYQLARGRISQPPWYTALWYAFGLATMYAVEKSVKGNPPTVD